MSSTIPLPTAESQPPLSESPQPHAHTRNSEGDAAAAESAAADAPTEAAAASSSSAPSSSVSVTDASTKACSCCLEDRPLSSFSSAQLKKKGKRVCNGCVAKKEAAATAQQEAERKEARRIAFEARLNATAETATPLECSSCARKVTRVASCPRCTVGCCSAACFMAHHCDVYVEARRTMPTTRVAEEDRLTPDEVMPAWNEIMTHLRQLSTPIETAETVSRCFASLDSEVHPFMMEADWSSVCTLYSPHILRPWWRLSCSGRLGLCCGIATLIYKLTRSVIRICEVGTIFMKACCSAAAPEFVLRDLASGIVSIRTADATSPCLLPNRLVHKFMTLTLWLVRAMDVPWLTNTFQSPADVSSDEFGMLPLTIQKTRVNDPEYMIGCDYLLAYVQHVDPVTDQRTLVPLTGVGYLPLSSTYCLLENHLGSRMLAMITQGGLPVRERGLFTFRNTVVGIREFDAATGWTGRLSDSFMASPVHVDYFEDDQFVDRMRKEGENWSVERKNELEKAIREVLDARKQPGHFHLVLAIKQLVGPTVWAAHTNDVLFIATPQLGLESELVELALLESLAEEAEEADRAIGPSDDAGHQAQLLIAHIEDECGASIAEVIERQKSRVQRMMEAQTEQLRIHAEAVERAKNRGKLAAADSSSADAAAAPAASSSASALAPASAASSSSSSCSASVAVVPLSACGSSSSAVLSAPAASWTSSKELQSVAALCKAGRVKYATITAAALRFLRTLNPVRVNRSGGSHTVFHFASGSPVTLVRPHGGDGTVSKHVVTKLYQTMHEAAMQQMEGPAMRATIAEAE